MTDRNTATIDILIVLFSHTFIDSVVCFFSKRAKKTLVFITDQFLHIGVQFIIYKVTTFSSLFERFTIQINFVLMILMIVVPCSIFINKLFEDLYLDTKCKGIFDNGSIIGILERLLLVIFAYFESLPAVAIIITAKTWARTNDLKETEFRDKYLLGTLASLVLALGCYVIFKFA